MDAVAKLEYEDDIADLWHVLDEDGSRMLTLDEFHAPSGRLLGGFKDFCLELGGAGGGTSGAVARAFNILDVEKKGHLNREEMISGCLANGWDASLGHPGELHGGLDFDGRGYVTIDELVFLEDNYLNRRIMEKSPEAVYAAKQREMRKKMKARAAVDEKIALEQFRAFLRTLFGNYIRAWRNLDKDCSFSLSKVEVFTACKRLGFKGEVRPLWRALDVYDDGIARLENVDRESAEVLAQFLRWCRKEQGGLEKVYKKLDKDGSHKVKLPRFKKGMKKLGYQRPPETVEYLFECLDFDAFGYLRMDNFEFLNSWRPPDWLTAQADPEAVKALKRKLLRKYGNFIKAWRQGLDLDSSNKLTWAEFLRSCDRVNFVKKLRAGAWRGLDDDNSGYVTLGELDEDANAQLLNFRNWADDNFGSVRLAFKQLDRDKSGVLSYSEFRSAVIKYGFIGDTRMLFDSFDINHSGDIVLENITFLEHWDLEEMEVTVPKKKREKKKEVASNPPTLALYRNMWEKNFAEELTEKLAKANKIHSKSAYYGFLRALAEDSRPQTVAESVLSGLTPLEPLAIEAPSMASVITPSIPPTPDLDARPSRAPRGSVYDGGVGTGILERDLEMMMPDKPKAPNFVLSTEGWTAGRKPFSEDGECLPISFGSPMTMPKASLAKLAWVEESKPAGPLPPLGPDSVKAPVEGEGSRFDPFGSFLNPEDMPDLQALENWRKHKKASLSATSPTHSAEMSQRLSALTDRDEWSDPWTSERL